MSNQSCPQCRQEMIWSGFQDQRYWYCRSCKKELAELQPKPRDPISDPGADWGDYHPASKYNPPVSPAYDIVFYSGAPTPCYNQPIGRPVHNFNTIQLIRMPAAASNGSRLQCDCGAESADFNPYAMNVVHYPAPSPVAPSSRRSSPTLGTPYGGSYRRACSGMPVCQCSSCNKIVTWQLGTAILTTKGPCVITIPYGIKVRLPTELPGDVEVRTHKSPKKDS